MKVVPPILGNWNIGWFFKRRVFLFYVFFIKARKFLVYLAKAEFPLKYFHWIFLNKDSCYYILKILSRYKELVKSYNYLRNERLKYNNLDKKIRVCFIITEGAMYDNIESIYLSMLENKFFNPVIVVLPKRSKIDCSYNNVEDICNQLYKLKIKYITAYNNKNQKWLDLRTLRPRVVFYTKPCDLTYRYEYHIDVVNQYALTAYVPYGIMTLNCIDQYNQLFNKKLWRIFCESKWHYQMYKKYGKIGSSNVIVSGHPTLDYILTPQPDTVQKDERYKKTIIWAPHWTVDSKFKKEFLSTGTFNKNYLFFLNLFKKYPDIKWVVKPHPLLKTQMTKILKAISSKEWEEYFKTLQSLPNVDIVEGHYIKYFINSDLLITDSLSFLTIYFFTGKPVILIKKDNKEPKELYNNYALEITETYYYANTESEIIASINKIIKGEDILLERRKKLLEKKLSEMKYNLGYNAGEFIARHIEDYFKRNEKEKL